MTDNLDLWEDELKTTANFRVGDTKRVVHSTLVGGVRGDGLVADTDMETLGEVTGFFNSISILGGGGSSYAIDSIFPPPPISALERLKMTLVTDPGANSISMKRNDIDGGGTYLTGWKKAIARVYLLVNDDFRTNGVDALFMARIKPDPDKATTTQTYQIGLGKKSSVTEHNWVLSGDVEASISYQDSGIAFATSGNVWTRLEIEFDDDTILFKVEGEVIGSTTISNQLGLVEVEIFAETTNPGGSTYNIYWDLCELFSVVKHNDSVATFPDQQHEFSTIDIAPANLTKWNKVVLDKKLEDLSLQRYLTVSVYATSTGAVIPGYSDLSESEIDISGISHSSIYLRFKFYDENHVPTSFDETATLTNIQVWFEPADISVVMSVTENTYNPGDLVSPITTKTGYRVQFTATAQAYYDDRKRKPNDPDVEVESYWFDFGDGLNSGWIAHNVVSHIYTKHSLNIPEAGADQKWNVVCRIKYDNGVISGFGNTILVEVLNANPVARMMIKPIVARMSGAGPSASVKLFGNDSFDIDDNGTIALSSGYKFDYGDGSPQVYQNDPSASHSYTIAGTYILGLTVKDDLGAESTKLLQKITVIAALVPTSINFTRRPEQITEDFSADYDIYHTVQGGLHSVEPLDTRSETVKMGGKFGTKAELEMIRGYVQNQTLISFTYKDLNDSDQTINGYIVSLSIARIPGFKRDLPWKATVKKVDTS
jgi:hypothetical protein